MLPVTKALYQSDFIDRHITADVGIRSLAVTARLLQRGLRAEKNNLLVSFIIIHKPTKGRLASYSL